MQLSFDLAEYGDERRVIEEVLRCEEVLAWRAGSDDLLLTLDSLDECTLEVPKLATILSAELRRWPTARLRLRVACRSASFPSTLESILRAVLSEVRIVELLPLRRQDVAEIAQSGGHDSAGFLEAVEAQGLVALAIRPLTLQMLLVSVRKGALPANTIDLYRRAILGLCDEQNSSRRAAGQIGHLSPTDRMSRSRWIAGLTMLCGEAVFSTSALGLHPAPDAMDLDELTNSLRSLRQSEIPQSVREVLATGLFSSRGVERVGWAHQSYAEFLTAELLAATAAPSQVEGLLTRQIGALRRIVPRLRQIVGWLLTIDGERFGDLARADPEAVIDAQIGPGTPGLRQLVVDAALDLASRGELRSPWRRSYGHLNHAELVTQLRSPILDSAAPLASRTLAIEIAIRQWQPRVPRCSQDRRVRLRRTH